MQAFSSWISARPLSLIAVATGIMVLGLTPPAALAGPSNRHYLGGGAQVGRGMHQAVLGGKLQIRSFGKTSLSVRPDIIIGDTVQARAALTAERQIGNFLAPYAGAGISYNANDLQSVDPMLSAGVDVSLNPRIVVRLGGNWIFQDDETKAEALITGNYAFGN